ncbi:MAG TPA: NAD(P)/FAD-dependent oxidoreductase [Acidimicrobiales bacterium]
MQGTEGRRPRYDVVVIGAGPAGLGAALVLARARRPVLVIDDGSPRNAPAGHVHNYLGREGTPPLELLAIGRREVTGYGGEVVTDRVTGTEPLDGGGFRVDRRDGAPVEARRLLVTTGLVDRLPDVDGLSERWGSDVLHCPYCHGWEVRDRPVAVLATSPLSVHQALLWRQWTPEVTLILHDAPDPGGDEADKLAALGIAVVRGPAAAVEGVHDRGGVDGAGDGVRGVRLADGRLVPCRHVVVAPRFEARVDLLAALGVPTADFVMGDHVLGTHVAVDATGATAVPGVWAAGNVADPAETVIGAAAAGLRAAHAINLSLIAEAAEAAVAARRAGDPAHGDAEQGRPLPSGPAQGGPGHGDPAQSGRAYGHRHGR